MTYPNDVTLATLLSGENQSRNWIGVADGATQSQNVLPLPNAIAGGLMPNASVALGLVGAVGDYLKTMIVTVRSASNASVFVQDGTVANISSGTSGTNPLGTTALAVVASAPFSATANQYAGFVISVTYTPTGSATPIEIWTRIATHAAVVASTAFPVTLDHAIPVGTAITAWSLRPTSCREVVPFNTPAGIYNIDMGKTSVNGKWQVAVDFGVSVEFIGSFT